MQKLHLFQLLFLFLFSPISESQEASGVYCGRTRIQASPANSSLLQRMILCKSDKLYYRTSIGLFPISSIDYTAKLLTVSHSSCSSVSNFVSPHHLSAGFRPPSNSSTFNSLILFNCSKKVQKFSSFPCENIAFNHGCDHLSPKVSKPEAAKGMFSCLTVDDLENLGSHLHPKDLHCTHYRRVYRIGDKYEVGTRISFDIPDHVPNPCNQCKNPDGICGAGLRCICHPKKCKDKVFSTGAVLSPCRSILLPMFFFTVMMEFFLGIKVF